jgi:hypothetical protein
MEILVLSSFCEWGGGWNVMHHCIQDSIRCMIIIDFLYVLCMIADKSLTFPISPTLQLKTKNLTPWPESAWNYTD